MSIFKGCREFFNTDDLYAVLKVDKTASDKELKMGYFKVSKIYHPDRVSGAEEKEKATKKFQIISKIYSILCDKEKRAVYDETGEVDEENDLQQDRDWVDYWRLLFPKVTLEDIQKFQEKYKDSEEERKDIQEIYSQFKGDMDQIMENILCSSHEDEPRVRSIIEDLIKEKKVHPFKAFTGESQQKKRARKRKAEEEAKEAEMMKKELCGDSDDSLTALIQKKQQSRSQQADNFLASLEEKYAKSSKPSKSRKGKVK